METILSDVDRLITPALTHWNHPSFFAYFATSSSAPGIFGELFSAAFDVKAMLWRTSPASTELEQVALDWLGEGGLIPHMQPLTGSEDFAFLLERCAGSYLIIGNGDGEGGCMVHNPGYDFNDACLATGAAYWVRLAQTFLA